MLACSSWASGFEASRGRGDVACCPGLTLGCAGHVGRDGDKMLIRDQRTETQGLHTVSFVSGNRASVSSTVWIESHCSRPPPPPWEW